jgi:hydrogenase expression/formation protein HypE
MNHPDEKDRMSNADLPPTSFEGPNCPLPLIHADQIVIGHGSGGRMTHDLVAKVFQPYLNSEALAVGDDFAALSISGSRLAVSTDSHIVKPLFFPGGDIGRLAVCGTVNDIAVSGARPLFLTAGFILEEGLEVDILRRILASMQASAAEAGVQFVAGDTKVVERGNCDGIFINTTGFGLIPAGAQISGTCARPGDAVLLTGTVGDHGIAVLAARGELGFETAIQSDVAPLNGMIAELLQAAPGVHVLRDPTRGGVATTLNEIAAQSKVCIQLHETEIPLTPAVQSACEMLGFDPLYIANEGKLLVILPAEQVPAALAALHAHPYGRQAVQIGEVIAEPSSRVLMKTSIGGTRIVDKLAGEILPRIC